MIRNLFAINLISHLLLFAPIGSAQQSDAKPVDPASDPPNQVMARVQEMFSLVKTKSPEAQGKLKQALSDESWYVRGEAARALGQLGDNSVSALLVPLTQDANWFVRDSALEALQKLKAPPVAGIEQMMASPDSYTRARGAAVLGALNYAPAIDSLIGALADKDEFVRREAAAALGTMKAAKATDPLIALLKDEDGSVRKAAAVALGKVGDKRAENAILGAEKNSEDWEYAASLYRLGNRGYLEQVIAALGSPYADARIKSFQTLLEFADSRALPQLMEFAAGQRTSGAAFKMSAQESISTRLLLAEGLAKFDKMEARPALTRLLEDPEPQVRAVSVATLAKAGKGDSKGEDEAALTLLIAALRKEKSPPVLSAITDALATFDRARVADMLLNSKSPEGKLSQPVMRALAAIDVTTDTLLGQLATGDASARLRAADRLALMGDAKAVPPLIEALATSKELQLRVAAAQALGALKDRRAVDALVAASGAAEKDVRLAAVNSLGLINDHTSAEALFVAAKDTDQGVRDAAVQALAAMGVSVERLSADMTNANWQVRVAAITTFARLGDNKATPLVITALKDADSRVRSEAARTLGQLSDESAITALINSLGDSSAEVRVEATFALGRLKDGRAIAPLTTLLTDRDSRVSLAAAESLARMKDPRAVRVLVGSLAEPDWRVRARAAQVLAHVAGDSAVEPAIVPLARAITDKDPVVRYYAAEALIGIGAKATLPLIEVLRSERESDRARVTRVLWRIGPPAVEPLIALVQDKSATPETRSAAAQTLGMIGDVRAIKSLMLLLRDDRYFVRQQAAFALGQMGDGAIDQLLDAANSSSPATKESAIEALGNFKSPRAVDKLIDALSDSNATVRSAAVKALGETSSERALTPLLSMLKDESSALRSQAAAALARLGQVALTGLIGSLRDNRPYVRQLAAEALGDIGSKEAVAPLVELIAADQSGARAEAIEALGKIGDPAAIGPILSAMRSGSVAVRKKGVGALARFRDSRAVDALTAALSDKNEEVRQSAAAGLGDIGDARVVEQLERVADNDSSGDVRTAAVQAIERIRAQSRAPRDKTDQQRISRP
ncbi:MAG TPA: HEAT repeat domain-containing protein [Blastocatellia bacterium]|nr:HEAT repeat domain-containing protein [Blastocatellia bacterium]